MKEECKVKRVQGTPFDIVSIQTDEKQKHAVTMGKFLLTEWKETYAEAEAEINPDNWHFLGAFISVVASTTKECNKPENNK